jgi:sRNA-binding carbon storage regulator CsrA
VLKVSRGRVKLGFIGPSDVPVHREEIQQRIDSVVACPPRRPRRPCVQDSR